LTIKGVEHCADRDGKSLPRIFASISSIV